MQNYILTSTVVIMSFVAFGLFVKNNFHKSLTHKGIALLLFFLFIRFLSVHLYMSGNIYDYPHFLLFNHLTFWVGIPTCFLLLLYHISGRKKLSSLHAFHFLPFVLFIINFRDVFIASASQKVKYILYMEQFGYSYIWQKGILFSPFLLEFLRVSFYTAHVLLIGFIIFKDKRFNRLSKKFQNLFKLIFYFLMINLIPIVLGISDNVYLDSFSFSNYTGLITTMALVMVGFFFMPDFLYGDQFEEGVIEVLPSIEQEFICKESKLMMRIEGFFDKDHPFLNPDFSLKTVEKELNLSGRYISAAIKLKTGLGFNQYTHQKRMDYFLHVYCENEDLIYKPIEDIAVDLGFNSINTFYVQFKNTTGQTPNEFKVNHNLVHLS